MPGRLRVGLLLLRGTAVLALLLLVWNPVGSRPAAGGTQSLVLIDASLSMTGHGGPWRAALDSARAAARSAGAIVWRFGTAVAPFDTTPPADGASRLAPALEAAAARGGPVTVITDGAVQDVAALPPDIARRPRVVVLPRPAFRDAFVAGVRGPHRVGAQDTIRLAVDYGAAGTPDPVKASPAERTTLVVSLGGRRVAARDVGLPDSGTVSTELMLPASRLPAGWSALEVALEGAGAGDREPRDDARLFVLEVSPEPAVVILAAPPDWESRFLARTLQDVARVPVKTYVETDPAGGWREGVTLQPVVLGEVQRAVEAARLVVLAGEPARFGRVRLPARVAVLAWPNAEGGRGQAGDWYVQAPPASPLAGMLAGLPWDSLPPATALQPLEPDSATGVALAARLARRGLARPLVLLRSRGESRRATIAGAGLWRWSFRGGVAALAYRSLVASLADWLLGGGAGRGERFAPVTLEAPNGLPLVWQWTGAGAGAPRDVAITLQDGRGARHDTLRFDAAGRAAVRLPPGVYRYTVTDQSGGERGLVAVETYSDEWRPAPAALAAQPGLSGTRLEQVGLRDRWWLFVIAVAALAGEWAWRRRMGLP